MNGRKKSVLITGASRGIGRAAALKFAAEGYAVAANYRENDGAARSLRDEICSRGGVCELIRADISDSAAAENAVARTAELFGDIDVLINNAGIALPQGLFTDFTAEDDRRIFETNVFGMMNCSRAAARYMVRRHSGAIVNLSSVWGVCGGSCEAIYSAAKAAVIGFTKALARELAPSGIRVNAVAPGMIDTDMNAHLSQEDAAAFCDEVPLGRVGKPCEIAELIYFLASDGAAYITGQTVSADGGIV